MAMTRKHYIAAAEVIKEALDHSTTQAEDSAISTVAQGLAVMYKRDNSNFRYDTFYAACGLDPWGNPVITENEEK